MAKLTLPSSIYPAGPTGMIQMGVASFSYATQDANQIHIKTDIYYTHPGCMAMVEAVGYSYGTAQPIRCAWTFYQWNNTLYRTSVETVYPGMTPNRIYISTDGYVCLQAAIGNAYFVGFTLNVYCGNKETPGTKIDIQNIVANTTTGNFF